VPRADLQKSLDLAAALAAGFGGPAPTSAPEVAKLSVFGTGMRSHTGVANRMFQSLADAGINVDMISTSEVRLNAVIDGEQGQKGLDALRREFADAML
jgi:aspartate kinase